MSIQKLPYHSVERLIVTCLIGQRQEDVPPVGRYCLLAAADQLILMVQRRVADLWRHAAAGVGDTVNWAELYRSLLNELTSMSARGALPDVELLTRLEALVASHRQRRPPGRASLVRERLIEELAPFI